MTIDELSAYGMQRMDEEEIDRYLEFHHHGVLGLPSDGAPYLLPMAYGYDGGSRLIFTFVVADESRKLALTDAADVASFLVYKAETMFDWRSVVLVGSIRRLSDEDYAELSDSEIPTWRPELFETASESEETHVFEFRIEERTGVKHTIQPPGYWQLSSPERT